MQLIDVIPTDLQKLLKYFSETTDFVFFTKPFKLSPAAVSVLCFFCPTIPVLHLNESELVPVKSALLFGGSSFLKCHKDPDVSG